MPPAPSALRYPGLEHGTGKWQHGPRCVFQVPCSKFHPGPPVTDLIAQAIDVNAANFMLGNETFEASGDFQSVPANLILLAKP